MRRRAQEGNLKLGSWQMVLWQPRWVHAEVDGLCYQKITADERPIGREKRVEFRDVREIEELEFGEFVLQCQKRDYTFKAPDENKCQVSAVVWYMALRHVVHPVSQLPRTKESSWPWPSSCRGQRKPVLDLSAQTLPCRPPQL